MRNYLKNIEFVGAVLIYREGEQCRWSLDWLYTNCDRVCLVLDNHDGATEAIALEYQRKFPEQTYLAYTSESFIEEKNKIQGQVKKRFKNRQHHIREHVVKELRKMHDKKPIDLLIWPDSDETFIDEFPEYLTEFWDNQPNHDFMMLGFLEVYDSMRILMSQKMAPHGRVFKYKPELTVFPWLGRTRYHPYIDEKRPWKLRHVVIHVNHLTEEYRQRRKFFDNVDFTQICDRHLWFLPKDVRKMTAVEISDYQPGHHQAPSQYPSITLDHYLNHKHKYKEYELWSQH